MMTVSNKPPLCQSSLHRQHARAPKMLATVRTQASLCWWISCLSTAPAPLGTILLSCTGVSNREASQRASGLSAQEPGPAPLSPPLDEGGKWEHIKEKKPAEAPPNHGALEGTEGGGMRANPDPGSRSTSLKLEPVAPTSKKLCPEMAH